MRFLLSIVLTLLIVASSHAQQSVMLPPEVQLPVIELTQANTILLDQGTYPQYGMIFIMTALMQRATLPADQTMYVLIYSPGGRTDVAESMAEALNSLPNTNLVCVECASSAAWIFQKSTAARLIVPNTRSLMHEIADTVRPSTIDTYDAKGLKEAGEKFNQIFMERANMSVEEYHERIDGKDWEVDAAEMMKLNLADALVTFHCDEAVATAMPLACDVK